MSGDYDNELRGVLFRNSAKRDGKQDADYRGNIQVNGVEFWLDAWLATSKDGTKYMQLRAKPKVAPRPAATPSRAAAAPLDDDIPF